MDGASTALNNPPAKVLLISGRLEMLLEDLPGPWPQPVTHSHTAKRSHVESTSAVSVSIFAKASLSGFNALWLASISARSLSS
ncbi:MAG: hypothetical protein A4E44_00410 [Methanosaeta sp. PtaB.Bin018]|nr:MAG: hypothetical protein A4E44_00410 [Methanosaeta sp. PtaB.Bin018]OPY48158.1 MAG: hypothetical protein A4E46_00074 [Methanosaeta sp. PtaU1.Bin016]